MSFRYERPQGGGLIWVTPNGRIPLEGSRLSIVMHPPDPDVGMATLIKHGSIPDINLWISRFAERTKMVSSGHQTDRMGVQISRYTSLLGPVIRADGALDIEEINRAITCTGYWPTFMRDAP
jgi:hypothetical protein